MNFPVPASNPPRILVVDDEPKTRDSIAESLEIVGWMADVARRGREMLDLFGRHAFDLVILDWMLPGRSGPELVRHLRARGAQVPVLMLTARDSVGDRVKGLECGADDYLVKPFALAELIARCRALLRRPILSTGQLLQCQDLQLDTRARVAVRAGEQIPLSPREVDVLEFLLRYQGQIVTREMLERELWREGNRFTSLDNVIDVQMMRVRRKVDGERTTRLIHTLRGVGYRLGPEAEPAN